jgi:hypothetical protein
MGTTAMGVDPEFLDVGQPKWKRPARRWWRWVCWLFVAPSLLLSCDFLMMTGSPFPLWYSERLKDPAAVVRMTENQLVLADGRAVSLPFIRRLPRDDPAFLKALQRGVEVGADGEVIGLVKIHRFCGNDPFVWKAVRIKLSELAGLMDPDGIDDRVVDAETIAKFKEHEDRSLNARDGLPSNLREKLWQTHLLYEGRLEFLDP